MADSIHFMEVLGGCNFMEVLDWCSCHAVISPLCHWSVLNQSQGYQKTCFSVTLSIYSRIQQRRKNTRNFFKNIKDSHWGP